MKKLLYFVLALWMMTGHLKASSCEDCGWNLSADVLAWVASEEASAVWADVIEVGLNTSSFGAPDFKFSWDYGFRLAIGRQLNYDHWDTQLRWTRFCTANDQSASTVDGAIHPEFFAADLSDDLAQSATINWALRFNMIDLELGRMCSVSKYVSVRPYLGLKGGWIYQPIHVQYNDLTIDDVRTGDTGNESLNNNFWGVGPFGGVETRWQICSFGCHAPSIIGDVSSAALWGTWDCTDLYENTAGSEVEVNMKKSQLGALMLRAFLGLGWDVDINRCGSHLSLRIGYEMQLWLNQLRLPTSQLIQLHGDLTLQGVTFDCRFDF